MSITVLGRGTELTVSGWWVLQGLAAKTARVDNLMAKPRSMQAALLRGALLGATALAIVNSPLGVREAAAKVGVTSATDGDPLGKPPQEAERVLRIGIDVQANELITTNANDRAHLVFLDGSSLTVGPNAQLTIDKFVFDPNTKTGELAISASKGVLRLVGGKISKNTPITITTPSSTIGIRGGISIHDVSQQRTDSMFVFGKDMAVRGNSGLPQVATRPGSLITATFGQGAAAPVLVPVGGMNGSLAKLEGKPSPSGNSSSGGGGGSGNNADQSLKSSGFSAVNSNQAPRIIAPGVADNFGSGPGGRNRNPNETIATVLTNANQGVQQQQAVQAAAQQIQVEQRLAASTPTVQPELPPPPPLAPPPPPGPLPPAPVSLPAVGTVTYAGDMSGSVNGRSAGGTYQNAWNFATRSGNFTATFDNRTYQGTMVSNGNSPIFGTRGPVQSNSGSQMEAIGIFLGRGSQPQYQFGAFTVQGPRYSGGGTFLGEKR
jgi:hypothetical protein